MNKKPANVTKKVSTLAKALKSRMGAENKSKIASYQKMDEDNRVGVPVKKFTE